MESMLNEFPNCKVLCVTEHWKSQEVLTYLTPKNFKLASAFCRKPNQGENTYGGSAVYVRRDIKWKENKKQVQMSEEGIFECASVQCSFSNGIVVIVSIYRPPSGSFDLFIQKLERLLIDVSRDNNLVIIGGDFNVELIHDNPRKMEMLALLSTFNLSQTIFENTRAQSCIDNFFTNITDWQSCVFERHISDHQAQMLTFVTQVESNIGHKYGRYYSQENKSNFLTLLGYQDWSLIYELGREDVNTQWNIFINTYSGLFNQSFPLKIMLGKRVDNKIYKDPLVKACKNKLDSLLVLCKYNPQYRELYNLTKKEYDTLVINKKSSLYEERIASSDNKNKTMWAICNEILGKNNKNDHCLIEGDPIDIANYFNNFLINVVPNMRDFPKQALDFQNIFYNNCSLYCGPVKESDIIEAASCLKNKYSSGEDDIPICIVKFSINQIKEVLAYIVGNSFKYGIFPEQLKMAVIKPLFKSGEKDSMNSYRPISILNSFSKIFEHIMCKRVLYFFNTCNIFSDAQHGFLKGRSTQTAIFQFTKKILDLLEKDLLALGLFLDLSKAYDCLDRELLIKKLERYGVRDNIKKWFESYLSERKQRVQIIKNRVKVKSNVCKNMIGVPQGSVLGHILFIIFINDLANIIDNPMIALTNFADDSNIVVGEKLVDDLISRTDKYFDKAREWFNTNRLVLNEQKTNIVVFRTNRSRKDIPTSVPLINQDFELSTYTKFLGIYIDQFLRWDKHIESINKKLSKICYSFRITSKYLSLEALRILYHANVESVLRYGLMFWGAGNIASLFVLQKRIIRLIDKMGFQQSCRGVFKEKQILMLYGLYLFECLMFLHKHKYLFTGNNRNFVYDTRTNNINFPIQRLTLSKKNPAYMCIKFFNKLPNELKVISNFKKFKHEVRNLLINLEPYCINDYLEC
ncbi:unnamed protein product [Callosobruchus maculatus]|uniref:Reverse transcriptase domain-containing protein n=1 Tax=Callosobruchus maculatus TaxID=64391 RepID=A0A653DHJ7_CALMS|nr:unnamed protein product [Callosobruchus maculatus]